MEQVMMAGSISAVVYQNPENGYGIIRMDCDNKETITVVGTIPMGAMGERLQVTGHWINHPTYGRQLEAELLERLMPETSVEILKYLSAGAVKGVGRKTAQRIVDAFGDKSLEVMEHQPEALERISGISAKKAQEISANFAKRVGMRRLIEFMAVHHLPMEQALTLYRYFGDMAVDALRDDPYMLTEEEFGADFARADAFAVEMGVAGEDPRRVEAGTLFELRYNLGNGHTFLPRQKLVDATCNLLSLEESYILSAIGHLHEMGKLVETTIKDIPACYLPSFYQAEEFVTSTILDMVQRTPKLPGDLATMLAKIEANKDITYSEEQRRSIVTAATHQITLVTGGPGTGKTTTLDGILDLLDAMGIESLLAAPTGRAAKRLGQVTGRSATTIHRMLEAQFSPELGAMVFCKNEEEPLEVDAVVIDEMSMVDLLLMEAVLRALPPKCRLILVGDPDQLPSVGAGNVFSDIIRSKLVEGVRLTEIYRQAQESLIVMNAHAINQGVMPDLTVKNKDFFFMPRRDPDNLVQTVCDLCNTRLPKSMGIPSGEIQVLSPTRKHTTGTVQMNKSLQTVLNPPDPQKREKTYGETVFRQGDRVMQVKNNYDLKWVSTKNPKEKGYGVFNGDLGIIQDIQEETELLTVLYDGERLVEYGFDMLMELEMAYAMTVHKSQGSEYQAVILVASQASPYLLTRSILYTAITRARDILIIIGDGQVVSTMVQNDRQQRRYSGLKIRLQQEGRNREIFPA